MTNPGSIKGPTVADAMLRAGTKELRGNHEGHTFDETDAKCVTAIYTAMEATRTATNRASEEQGQGASLRETGSHASHEARSDLRPTGFDPARFQARVDEWLIACFGIDIARDGVERNHRFLEESLELVQACGCTASEAHQLVDYTFGRPVGEAGQEVGGVMNTLAALCLARGLDMNAEGDREMVRCWQKIERIREKQRNKPKHSPLPESAQ